MLQSSKGRQAPPKRWGGTSSPVCAYTRPLTCLNLLSYLILTSLLCLLAVPSSIDRAPGARYQDACPSCPISFALESYSIRCCFQSGKPFLRTRWVAVRNRVSLHSTYSQLGPVPSDASIIALTPQFFPDHHSQRVKISYGPYKVPSMHDHNEMRGYSEPSTTLPCNDCLITWMQAGLEFADGTTANAEAGMWLHHAVFSNVKRRDVVCPMKRHGDRFFASGNERTPVNICREG